MIYKQGFLVFVSLYSKKKGDISYGSLLRGVILLFIYKL